MPFSVLHLLAEDQKRGVLDLTVIVDPLSRGAQKLAGVVNGLVRVVNADVRLIMNPKAKLSELPLKRFFRFSFSEEATFDADGATVTPSVQFTELPNKQLLTLNMIPPDSWMVQPVFARYDLDNLKMETVSVFSASAVVPDQGGQGRDRLRAGPHPPGGALLRRGVRFAAARASVRARHCQEAHHVRHDCHGQSCEWKASISRPSRDISN